MLRDFGGTLTPFLGGPEQRINRLGTRLGIRVSMPPMRNGDNGRIFVSRLLQAKQDRLLMDWPPPGFTIGAPGSPLVSTAASGGTALAIKTLTPRSSEDHTSEIQSTMRKTYYNLCLV